MRAIKYHDVHNVELMSDWACNELGVQLLLEDADGVVHEYAVILTPVQAGYFRTIPAMKKGEKDTVVPTATIVGARVTPFLEHTVRRGAKDGDTKVKPGTRLLYREAGITLDVEELMHTDEQFQDYKERVELGEY